MERTEKQVEIDGLRERFSRMLSAVFVDFQGLDVATVTALRDELRKAKVEYRVAKNTLIRRALEGRPALDRLHDVLKGMTAVAWSYDEPASAAKVLKEFAKKNDKLHVKAGLIENDVLAERAVFDQLATMPGRDELRAKLLATFQAPMQQFVRLLAAPHQNLVYLLEARRSAEQSKE